jgi:biopolymer transport protein ExbD
MRHYFGAESKVRIEIIPMIDIMMFLLVFFMLATLSMVQGSGLKMNLPQSSTATQVESAKLTLGFSNSMSSSQIGCRLDAIYDIALRISCRCSSSRRPRYRSLVTYGSVRCPRAVNTVALGRRRTSSARSTPCSDGLITQGGQVVPESHLDIAGSLEAASDYLG